MEQMRQRENDMVVRYRENIFDPLRDPFPPRHALAFGAVTVSAGIVVFLHVAAAVALVDVNAIGGRAAGHNGMHHFALLAGQFVLLPIHRSVLTEDVGDFPFWSIILRLRRH